MVDTINNSVKNKAEVVQKIKEYQTNVQNFGVEKIGLFGSFVRDKMNQNSDIDILVIFKPELKTFDNFMGLAFFLEDIFGRKIDLITTESLSPYFGAKILQEVEYVLFSD